MGKVSFVRGVLCVGLSLFAGYAFAAPYCAVFSWGKQCYYYSWSQCQQAAGSQGACIVNQDEQQQHMGQGIQRPTSGAPFCVVASYGTQCYYYDAQSCREAAAAADAVCAVNPNRSP